MTATRVRWILFALLIGGLAVLDDRICRLNVPAAREGYVE